MCSRYKYWVCSRYKYWVCSRYKYWVCRYKYWVCSRYKYWVCSRYKYWVCSRYKYWVCSRYKYWVCMYTGCVVCCCMCTLLSQSMFPSYSGSGLCYQTNNKRSTTYLLKQENIAEQRYMYRLGITRLLAIAVLDLTTYTH